MSAWGDIKKVGEDVGAAASVPLTMGLSTPAALGVISHNGNPVGGGGSGSGGSTPATALPTSGNLSEDQLNQLVGSLTGSQANAPSSQLAQQIASSLGALPLSEEQTELKKFGTDPLATQISSDLSGSSSSTTPTSNYGFDPLNMSQFMNTTLGPWLKQMNANAEGYTNQYAGQVQDALKGASPELQKAYAVTDPEMQEAMSALNQNATQQVFAQPELASLLSGLNTATTSAKAAQYASAEEPYVAATQGIGTTPTNGTNQNNANLAQYYASLYQQALNGQTGTQTGVPSTALGSNPSLNAILGSSVG